MRGYIASAIIALSTAYPIAQVSNDFTTLRSPGNGIVLEGNFQSCREADGYSERVYDHVVNGVKKFEVHLGPRYEFAFVNNPDFILTDRHAEHDSSDNLLTPYKIEPEAGRAGHEWKKLPGDLILTVRLAGGSRTDCESWYVLLKRKNNTSSNNF